MSSSFQTLRGGTRLLFDSIEGVATVVERMHETIARRPLPLEKPQATSTRAHGMIASGVYSTIRGVNGALRYGIDHAMGLVPTHSNAVHHSAAEIRLLATVNGVIGDHLEATGNTLALPMTLIAQGRALKLAEGIDLPRASPHIVVLVHGLCLSELSWKRRNKHCIGQRLEQKHGYSPLFLRYNTGRHISTNGREFNQLLQQLCESWPVPVESVSLVGHSMGGLVIRSACHYASRSKSNWLSKLDRVVCLGSPHHGAPLERAGHAFDRAVGKLPYVAPLAVGKGRSAGIKDLRHGNLLDEDWQGQIENHHHRDQRRVVPLLPNVEYYFAAATLGKHRQDPLGHVLGDMLVRLDSATGSHDNSIRQLKVKQEHCRIFYGRDHFDLLDDEEVHLQVEEWLCPAVGSVRPLSLPLQAAD